MATSLSSYVDAPVAAREPSSGVSLQTPWRHPRFTHVLEMVLLGAASFLGLLALYHALGAAISIWRAGVIAGAFLGTYIYVRRVMCLPRWTALTAASLFPCHPLCVTGSGPTATLAESLPLLFAPWMMLGCRGCLLPLRLGAAAGVAALLGLLSAVCVADFKTIILLLSACLGLEFFLLARTTKVRRVDSLTRLATCLFFAAGVGVAASVAVARVGSPLRPIEGSLSGIQSPLAWVDRGGILSSRLENLPEDLLTGGSRYWCGSVMLLCLMAAWPFARADRTWRDVGLIVLAFFFTWLMLGQNLHEQLQRAFEFATVRRYVEPSTLHLLGVMTLALAAMGFLLFISVATLANGCRRWNLLGVLLASAAVMLWWRTSPADFVSFDSSAFIQTVQPLAAFLLICAAAVGMQRLVQKNHSRRARLVVGVVVMILMALDIFPYVETTWRRMM